ncbi:hypothetical protein D3H55_08525 [Bacillus salacetis]|uniref:Lipoprotein n=1 Tax=Bacillus salacetis TaxID=2315464 RepID=A0A3A1R0M4_9BACI|nr:hypothetical protein [Bacillus salacetis]RIW35084.1 hypothetical protein D3H55_08525 [Bacillus salacetis]
MKKLYAAALLLVFLIILAGCGNKKIEMIEKSSVSLSENGKKLEVHITLDDANMEEPETSFQVRLYAGSGELVEALGTDLFVLDEKYVSHKEGEKPKIFEIHESFPLEQPISEDELRKIIEDKDEDALEIDVLNSEKVFATEGIHTVE